MKVINEWRDSIFYTLLLAALISQIGGEHLEGATVFFLLVASFRESARAFAWDEDFSPILVGERKPLDQKVLQHSAGFLGNLSVLVTYLFPPVDRLSMYLFFFVSFCALVCFQRAGGSLTAIYEAYDKTMWDYPRKKDGGGVHTKKLIERLGRLTAIGEASPVRARA